jgi:hypothetical protein
MGGVEHKELSGEPRRFWGRSFTGVYVQANDWNARVKIKPE